MPAKLGHTFYPYGPYDLPIKADGSGFDYAAFKKAAQDQDEWGEEPGCYVICRASGRGLKAIYIGKAANQSLLKRVYQHRAMISSVMGECSPRQKLKIFLLHYEKGRGPWNEQAIDFLETELISSALKNKIELRNIQKTVIRQVRVTGVLNSGAGRRPPQALALRSALGMKG